MKIYEIEETILQDFIEQSFSAGYFASAMKCQKKQAEEYAKHKVEEIAYCIGSTSIKEVKG